MNPPTAQVLVTYFLVAVAVCSAKKLTETNEENCEVCVKFVGKFIDQLTDTNKGTVPNIEADFRRFCKNTKKDDNRFCYYIGGLEESATGMLGELSKPISWGMPADKICMKLYRKDSQICDLRYDKSLDLSNVDLKKLKVKDLKNILSEWDEVCKGCTEKVDFINLIEELMPTHAPESAAKRKAKAEL